MKRTLFITALCLAVWPAAPHAQTMGGPIPNENAQAAEARMNRDGYPYFVMDKPILPPEEKDKIRRYREEMREYQKAREKNIRAQFRSMSADERRYVIENYGFPQAVMPGFE